MPMIPVKPIRLSDYYQTQAVSDGSPIANTTFPTSLILTQAQESNLVQQANRRIDEMREQLGVQTGPYNLATTNLPWAMDNNGSPATNPLNVYNHIYRSWCYRRDIYQLEYDNDFLWRRWWHGGVFNFSNWSMNIAKRYTRLISAKSQDDIFGSYPFFSLTPDQHTDPDLAKQIEWYVTEKIQQSNFVEKGRDGIDKSLIIGEAVAKVSWSSRVTLYRGPATVMVDRTGMPLQTPKGNYIYLGDLGIPDPNVQGRVLLKKEPSFALPPAPQQFAFFPDLEQKNVQYEGLDIRILNHGDFLCPINHENVQEADCVVHLFDAYYEDLKRTYAHLQSAAAYFNYYESKVKQPILQHGEQLYPAESVPIVNCADTYIRGDYDQDGIAEDIWMVMDTRTKMPIWYDYMPNHMPKRPFVVIPGLEKVPNRWYGVGVFEALHDKQLYCDTQFNRVNWKSSRSSSVTFRNVNAVQQWKAGEQVLIGGADIWDITDPTFDKNSPPLFQVQLVEIDKFAMEVLNMMLQAAQAEMGIMGPEDPGVDSQMPSQKLATGIMAIERTGNVLQKKTEAVHVKAFEELLAMATDCVLEHMDHEELFIYPDSQQLVRLNREEIRRIPRTLKLLLSRARSSQALQTSAQVIAIIQQYYAFRDQNPEACQKVRDEYIQQLKALEVQDADDKLIEITDEEVQAWKQAKANASQQAQPPNKSITTNYADLAPSEQAQILQSEGVTPASVEEKLNWSAQQMAVKNAGKPTPQPPMPPQGDMLAKAA